MVDFHTMSVTICALVRQRSDMRDMVTVLLARTSAGTILSPATLHEKIEHEA
jgi:hypothetical protein